MARLLEHHALNLLEGVGVPVPPFVVVSSPEAAKDAAHQLKGPVVLKALIPVGARGKSGAIKMARDPEQTFERARELLGQTFVNFPAREILVGEALNIAQEFFVSL